MREIEPLSDLAVGQAFRGQLGNLQLLRRQLVARLRDTPAAALPGRAELGARLFAPRRAAQRVERVARGTQDGT